MAVKSKSGRIKKIIKEMKPVPSVDKFKSRREWGVFVWKDLIAELASAGSAKEVEHLLAALLTAHEKKQMVKRMAAASLLGQGKSYREIGEALWLSPTTISAVRKSLLENDGYVSRHTRKKKKK